MDKISLRLRLPVLLHQSLKQSAEANCRSLNSELIYRLVNSQGTPHKQVKCLFCTTLFTTGVGSGRRLDAKFCCTTCRISYNSLKRTL